MSEQYCIKWNDFNSHLCLFFSNLYSSEQLTDVTLRAEGSSFKCHKVVLSASSSYFNLSNFEVQRPHLHCLRNLENNSQCYHLHPSGCEQIYCELLGSTPSKHPVIILAGVKAEDVEIIIDFMYHGEMKSINYEHFISVLKTAEMLKINGLTEVTIFQTATQSLDDNTGTSESENAVLINDNACPNIEEVTVKTEESKCSPSVNSNYQPTDKRKLRDLKKYSVGNIDRALKDMEWGMSLTEASKLHNVPRSTLYSKAKHHSGLQIMSRKEHSNQDCHQALQAIAGGMSLKRAAEEYSIPKTVLWRRVQKRLDILSKVKCRKKRGGKQVPNFMESKLGRLRENKVHNRLENIVNDDSSLEDERMKSLKNERLSQAVEACKLGKMSQATASSTFQVPKTTIWRRLQKCSTQDEKPQIVIEKEDHQYTVPNEYEEYDSSSDTCMRTNCDSFQSPSLIVKPVILFNSNSENINNYENCVEISTEEVVSSSFT